ncbi:MAG: tetraacyldisaccharide 4'-kinase [Prevotellaceae bacterium]|jgi:tetraacyldisaccharide 4'-kinase|nr:tetraacyldisaccharide 4'-kinase [Prevotellaceae bacterium]
MNNRLVSWLVYLLLLPLSFIYKTAVWLRNRLYDSGLLMSYSFRIPVISIGNITVGGTGKTPHTEYLIDILQQNFNVAVLSRGYKRQSKGFLYVEVDDSATKTGDEPLQIKRKYPAVVVAVDADRVHGIRQLQTDYLDLDLILLDDAFQHRRVTPSLNIVLIDYNRPVGNDSMLPAGRLRDCLSSLYRADIIVITKCPANILPDEKQKHADRLKKYNKPVYFSRFETGETYPLSDSGKSSFDSSKLLAVSGIANPAVFFEELKTQYPEADIEAIAFADHHIFSEEDIRCILKKADSHTIVTTEKDSVRLIAYFHRTNKQIPDNIFCLPIKVKIDDSDSFNTNITNHVRKNKENSGLYQN